MDALEKKIAVYQSALDQQDEIDDKKSINCLTEDPQLTENLAKLRARQEEKHALKKRRDETGDKK